MVWKALPVVREGSKVSPRGPGGVGRPSRKFGRGQEVLLEVWDGWEALPEVWDGSKGTLEGPGVV